MASVLFILFGALFCTFFIGAFLSHLFKRQIRIHGRVIEYFGIEKSGGRTGRRKANWRGLTNIFRVVNVWIEHHMKPAKKKALEARLREAGHPMNLSPASFQLLQMLAGVTVFLCLTPLLLIIGANLFSILLLTSVMIALAVYSMSFQISLLIKRRRHAIQRMMPDFFDMVNLSIEAGMGLDASIEKISRQMKGPLSDEFLQTLRDIELGKSRREAFSDLRSRVPVHQFQSAITTLIQADILGVGMAKALRSLTQRIREQRTQMAREQAMKAPVKMLFPMLFFIFPALFIVMLGPLVIYLLEMLF